MFVERFGIRKRNTITKLQYNINQLDDLKLFWWQKVSLIYEYLNSVKGRDFLDCLSDYQLLIKTLLHWAGNRKISLGQVKVTLTPSGSSNLSFIVKWRSRRLVQSSERKVEVAGRTIFKKQCAWNYVSIWGHDLLDNRMVRMLWLYRQKRWNMLLVMSSVLDIPTYKKQTCFVNKYKYCLPLVMQVGVKLCGRRNSLKTLLSVPHKGKPWVGLAEA